MVSEDQYKNAIQQESKSKNIINQYHKEKMEVFKKRLKDNPIFSENELYYSATTLCPCGHGLAYPKECNISHYWDCSAILKGIADKSATHTAQLPFNFWDIKGESERRGTTRGVIKPKE